MEFIPDEPLASDEVEALVEEFGLPIDPAEPQYPSLRVACELARRVRKDERHVLFFVHGYNNDMGDVLKTAQALEERYDVEVVSFSWPANGGGVRGKLSYKSDKRDARASVGALERVLKAMHQYLEWITRARRARLLDHAEREHRRNQEARDELYARLLREDCPFTVNALYHSMGNYLLKQMLKSTINEGNDLLFDNVVLCQADTNHLDHALWVDLIRFRRRLFITLNENDYALSLSRTKLGSEQLARLGHYVQDLTSRHAHYVNLTGASWVRNSHSPFGEPAEKNDKVGEFFRAAFHGESAEGGLKYHPEGNWYAAR
ncbi:MAG: alpha/beta hydrolase [Arhodomonas sp.]|nr:alpha/beta hydrolase [Arhodomonas sp.]